MRKYFNNPKRNTLLATLGAALLLGAFHFAQNEIGILPNISLASFIIIEILLLILAVRFPKQTYALLLLAIPYELLFVSPSMSPINIRIYQLLIVNIILAFAWKKRKSLSSRKLFKESIAKNKKTLLLLTPLATLLVIHLLGLRAGIPAETIGKYAIIYVIFAALFFIVQKHTTTQQARKQTMHTLVIGSIVPLLFGILQNINGIYEWGWLSSEWVGRPHGPFLEAAWLGLLLSLLGVYVLRKQLKSSTQKYRWYAYLLLFFVTVIITVSRSSWVAMLALLAFTLVQIFLYQRKFKKDEHSTERLNNKKVGKQLLLLVGTILIAGVLVQQATLTEFNVGSRFLSIFTLQETYDIGGKKVRKAEENIQTRGEALKENWQLFQRHAVLGTGFGSIETLKKTGTNESSLIFQILLSTGILGAVCVLVFLTKLLRHTSITSEQWAWLLILVVTGLFEATMFLAIFWLGLAMVANSKKNT